MNQKLRDKMIRELLDENTELLPARLEGESLWLIHVMSAENCVNQRESVISRTTSGEVRGFLSTSSMKKPLSH